MIVIYGLGNNEDKYLNTKHNAGRIMVENIAQILAVKFVETQGCYLAKYTDATNDSEIWLVYPKGYMNDCGLNLYKLLKYYKVDTDPSDFLLLTIQDDSDQIVGNSKLSIGGGSAGHKGILSIYQHMFDFGVKNLDIWRLKLGIRPINNRLRSETFVLSKLEDLENQINTNLAKKFVDSKKWFYQKNISRAQNIFNYKIDSKNPID